MEKTYIEAQYRIDDIVFNTGYICIEKDSIIGIFTCDRVIIEIHDGKIYLNLYEHHYILNRIFKSHLFICNHNFNYLKFPRKYILESDSNKILEFELIRKVTNPNTISKLEKQFKTASEN